MTITDYIRMYLGSICGFGVFILGLFVAVHTVQQYLDERDHPGVRHIRNMVAFIATLLFAIYLFTSSVINMAPRGKVDRRAVDEQQERYENSLKGNR